MAESSLDSRIFILGGGLAGSMALAALKWKWPSLKVKVLERQSQANHRDHTWCFHEGDFSPKSWEWLEPLVSKTWNQYDVRFPKRKRNLQSKYHAIRSEEFHQKIRTAFPDAFVPITDELDGTVGIETVLRAARTNSDQNLIIRATGWPNSAGLQNPREYCWQKFVGLDLRLRKPHGLVGPILKDATVEQIDGYRFLYSLPWDETTLLVEDTYYSNTSSLDQEQIKDRILAYVESQGWMVDEVLRAEVGALPLEMSANARRDPEGEVSIGAASGLAHPVTGYTTSALFYQLECGIDVESGKGDAFEAHDFRTRILNAKRELVGQYNYFHLLNRMLFFAAEPKQRYQVLERFYGLDADLISRFYRGRLKFTDRARILIGRPPVPLGAAIKEWRAWQF